MSIKPQRPQYIGNLRERVTLQWATYEADEYGGQIPVWHVVGPVHARVEPLGGEERIQAAALTSPYTVRVHIRYIEGVTPSWRLSYNDRLFQIRAVSNFDERRMFLTLDCEGNVAT